MLNFLTESKWYLSAAQCFGVLIALAMILMNVNSVRLPSFCPFSPCQVGFLCSPNLCLPLKEPPKQATRTFTGQFCQSGCQGLQDLLHAENCGQLAQSLERDSGVQQALEESLGFTVCILLCVLATLTYSWHHLRSLCKIFTSSVFSLSSLVYSKSDT